MARQWPDDAGAPLVHAVNEQPVPVPAFEALGSRNQLRHCYNRHGFRYGMKAREMYLAGELDLGQLHKKSHAERADLDHCHVSGHG